MDPTFLVTSIVITATPGSGALFTIAAGLSHGTRAALVAAAGCTVGVLPHLLLALSGAAAVIAASPVLFESLRWLGVAYLLYLAWGIWREERGLAVSGTDGETARSPRGASSRMIRDAVLVNVLNPKLTIFFFVFLPMFVDAAAELALVRMAALGAVFMLITFAIFAGYGVAAARIRGFIAVRPAVNRWLGRGFALTFVALAVLLALTPHE